jgi:hypothetical protein
MSGGIDFSSLNGNVPHAELSEDPTVYLAHIEPQFRNVLPQMNDVDYRRLYLKADKTAEEQEQLDDEIQRRVDFPVYLERLKKFMDRTSLTFDQEWTIPHTALEGAFWPDEELFTEDIDNYLDHEFSRNFTLETVTNTTTEPVLPAETEAQVPTLGGAPRAAALGLPPIARTTTTTETTPPVGTVATSTNAQNFQFDDWVLPSDSNLYAIINDILLTPDIEDEPIFDLLEDLAGMMGFDCSDKIFCENAKTLEVVLALKIRKAKKQMDTSTSTPRDFGSFQAAERKYNLMNRLVQLKYSRNEFFKKISQGDNVNRDYLGAMNIEFMNVVNQFKATENGQSNQIFADVTEDTDIDDFPINALRENASNLEHIAYGLGTQLSAVYFLNPESLSKTNRFNPLHMRLALYFSKEYQLDWNDYFLKMKPQVKAAVRNALRLINEEYARSKTRRTNFTRPQFPTVDSVVGNYFLRNALLEAAANKYLQGKKDVSVSRTDRSMQDLWDGELLIRKSIFNYFMNR